MNECPVRVDEWLCRSETVLISLNGYPREFGSQAWTGYNYELNHV